MYEDKVSVCFIDHEGRVQGDFLYFHAQNVYLHKAMAEDLYKSSRFVVANLTLIDLTLTV